MARKKEPEPVSEEAQKVAETAAAVISQPVLGESPEAAIARMAYESKRLLFERGLGQPFHPNEIKWKPQMVKQNRCMAMPYIDARTVMDRLDDVCGVDGWRDEYEFHDDGSVYCRLTLMTPSGLFITKGDVGSPSEQPDHGDRKKAAVSDALKRAAVHFGIGRYLYRLPSQWVDYDPVKKRIAQVPKLPDWAVPKKDVPPLGTYVEPEEVAEHGEKKAEAPAAAAAGNGKPKDEEAEKKRQAESAAAASKKRTDDFIKDRLTWWVNSMAGCGSESQLTELIHENLKDEPIQSKARVWDTIQSYIKFRGWKWDKDSTQVISPD